jgi:hypothetical protein
MHFWRGRRCHAAPAYITAPLLERHGPGREVPDDGPQCCHPVRPQNHVVPCERHHVKIDVELHAIDDDWGLAEDTGASHALAIDYCRREPWARLDVQPHAPGGRLPDEAVSRPRVDERDEGSSAREHLELDRVADSHSRDRVQGENWGPWARLVGVPGIVANLEATDVEDPPADAVVSPRLLLVAVEAQA